MRNINDLRSRKSPYLFFLLVLLSLVLFSLLVYQIPWVQVRVRWRVDIAFTYVRGVFNPISAMPTALAAQPSTTPGVGALLATPTPTTALTATTTPVPPTATPVLSPTPSLTPTPIPVKLFLPAPTYEKQDPNNCGPASLSNYLRFYGWKGDQGTIVAKIKPNPDDRNVNVEELVFFARNYAGWLQTEYRVGGTVDLLKKLVAAGVPVMTEVGSFNEASYFPNDDHWSGHYLFINGYNDELKTFMTQDTWIGANKQILYTELDKNWQAFNRVYIVIFPPDKAAAVKSILGDNWDAANNRKLALAQSREETEKDPKNAIAWFNLGSNQVYFEDYVAAARSYDKAREIGLPMRFLRYQFGPFIAYFHSGRTEDLTTLADYALQVTFNSEEAMLWKGWGLYRLGKKLEALKLFEDALKVHPNYEDALYAISFVQKN